MKDDHVFLLFVLILDLVLMGLMNFSLMSAVLCTGLNIALVFGYIIMEGGT